MEVVDYFKVFVALLFMVNPLAAIPTYLGATADETPQERAHTTRIASIAVVCVLAIACVLGEGVLQLFGISLDSFRVAGGVTLMMLALAMLGGGVGSTKQRQDEVQDALEKENIGVVPLAIPLLSGPDSMSTMILYASQNPSWSHRGALVLIAALVGVAVWLCLKAADPMRRLLGRTGLNIATRVMGLIVAALAVEFITGGLVSLLPGLGGVAGP